jgi:hypothetical protein
VRNIIQGEKLMRNSSLLLGFMACIVPALVQAREVPSAQWGLDPSMPVETCQASGSQQYLKQLRCADGQELSWQRRGNLGPRTPAPEGVDVVALIRRYTDLKPLAEGERDHHFVDEYQLDCGGQVQSLYVDMYHCHVPAPTRAPEGFLLKR